MAYDFIGKIKDVKNEKLLEPEQLQEVVAKISVRAKKPLEIKAVRSEKEPRRDLLVKAKIYVSSMPGVHMDDLYAAISLFKFYLEEIANATNGMVSRSEGFYNDDKTYNSLY
ncbi:MAG: hypothetical protein FWE91_10660 [Defluviitaleaceae bacterium]|nr:hypothetical protein [Defluviitaleaceae bacterium]MCL2836356.1 hypothetical protein [Defluviitaleaceae bacterium]